MYPVGETSLAVPSHELRMRPAVEVQIITRRSQRLHSRLKNLVS